MSGIPRAFFPLLTTFSEFSKKKIRINTIGRDTATPGELVQILLPEGKCDISTFSLGGLLTVAATGGIAQAPAIEQLIESVLVEVGSLQIHPSFNFYGHIFGMFSDLQGSWNKRGQRQILSVQPVSATPVVQTNVPFQLSNWIGFLNDVRYLPTDRLPPVRITIRLAMNNVLACGAGVTGAAYSLNRLYATMDVMKLSPVYDELMSKKLASSPLQIPYTNYSVVPGVTAGLTNTVRWSTTTDALHKVYCTFIPGTYQNLIQPIDTATFLSPAFTRGSPNLGGGFNCRLTVNGNSFPDQGTFAERGEILLQTLEVLNENNDITSTAHPNLTTLQNFCSKFFVFANSFTYDSDGPDAAYRKCGLSALGQNLQGSWETTATNGQADANLLPLVILESRAVLEVGPARSVRVLY